MSAATDYIQLTHAASEIDGTIDEVYAARGSYGNLSLKIASKQDELTQSQLAAANSGITAEKLTADEAALAGVVDDGAKNLVQIMQDSLSIYNIVFSVNKQEGTITITGGTASAYKTFIFFGDPDNTGWSYGIPIPKGTYVLSGLPSGASQTGVRYILGITTSQSDTRTTTQIWDGDYVFTIGNDTTRIDLAAYVPAGQDLSTPFVFKPMICSKSQWDVSHQFEPYALSNPILTPAAIKAVNEGAKNLVDTSTVVSGVVTFTQDSDYYVTASPTNTDPRVLEYDTCQYKFRLPAGNYMLSMDIIETTSQNNAICWIFKSDGTNIANKSIKGLSGLQTLQFTLSAETDIGILLKMYTAKIRLMLCTKAEWAVSPKFVPYALSNPTLTPAAIKAVDEGAKNLLKITASSSSGNVNFTVNGDGTITVDGTAGTSNVVFAVANGLTIPAGNYYISMFDNSAYYSDKMYISAQFKNTPSGQSVWTGHEYYTDTQINPAGDIQAVAIVVKAGQKISQTVKPMICTAADWAISQKFVSYCPTMAEMYAMILALQNGTRSAPALAKAEPEEIKEPEAGEEEMR